MPETKAKIAHNGRISLYATQGIGQKQFSLNAPASRLKKSCRGLKSNFLSYGHMSTFSAKDLEISAAKSLKKAVSKFATALVGQKGTKATEKRVALEAVQEAVAELLKLVEGEEE